MPSLSDVSKWAITEFVEAELGDWRRTQRLVELAALLADPPSATLPEACGDGAMLKSASRFFANDLPDPSWGVMLNGSGRVFMLRAPWMAMWAGVAVSLAVFGCNMLGDARRDVLDPRLRDS